MNLLFRFLRVLLTALLAKGRTSLVETHYVRSSVWLGDQDPTLHMTNSRYCSFTDLGIMNYLGRTKVLLMARRKGWAPVIQAESLTYYRSMKFPQKFVVETTLVGWQEAYLCFHHVFKSRGKIVAESRMVARLVGRNGLRVTSDMVLEGMGVWHDSPPLHPRFVDAIEDLKNKPS